MSEKLLDVLSLFAGKSPLSANEVVEMSGLSQSTAYRLLGVLRGSGFLVNGPQGLLPGPVLMEIAERGRASFDITAYARSEMRRLSELTGETVLLSALSGNETMAVDVIHADQPIRFAFEVGQRRPPHAGASSKILFAAMSPARQKRLLEQGNFERKTPQSTVDPSALKQELELIRTRGYHVTVGEWEEGVLSIAAPIICEQGVWGISIVGLAFRFDEGRIETAIAQVKEAAQRIMSRIEGLEVSHA